MRIIRAKYLGMCFGVRDAIALALERAQRGPLTVYGDLVHNEAVLSVLRQKGVKIELEVAKVPTPDVMITAHGASERTIGQLRQRGLNVTEATCPLVHHAHQALKRLVHEQFHPVVIGKREHVEVRGLTEDFAECDVILNEEDVNALNERPRFGVVAQTTQPLAKMQWLVGLLRRRFPQAEVRFEDTVCQPTKQRQLAALEMAQAADVVVVVGGANSNNTRELVATCRERCPQVYHVQTAADLQPEWFDGAETVGLTAGTSTPDGIIEGVEHALKRLAATRQRRYERVPADLTLASSARGAAVSESAPAERVPVLAA
jgi:4-hydroxy-3-methylbut-2-en-1-yl diphosphate reductase